jgi:hypothetical protein
MGQSFFVLLFLSLLDYSQAEALPYVDTMIVVAVDVSGSVNDDEYNLQKSGIVEAFSDPSVQQLLLQCSTSGIGITYVEWSGQRQSNGYETMNPFVQVVPWTQLLTPEDMIDFANKLLSSPRSSRGETDIARALDFARQLLEKAPFQSHNKIVSLSTDGQQGFTIPGVSPEDFLKMERDKLANLGVLVNAIGIETALQVDPRGMGSLPATENQSIEAYLNQNVRSGSSSFVTPAADFKAYSEAFKKQLYVMMNACIS